MTFRLERSNLGPTQITLHITSGELDLQITQDVYYLRHFWGELGHMLRTVEDEEVNRIQIVAEAEQEENDEELARMDWEGNPDVN